MTKQLLLIFLFASLNAFSKGTIYEIEKQINRSVEKSAQLDLEKEKLEQQINDLQKRIRDRKVLLLRRTSALSYLKRYQWGALLSRAESLSQLDRNLKIFKNLNHYDLSLFKDYVASLKMLSASRTNLQHTITEIASSVEKMKGQQQELALKEEKHLQEVRKQNLASLIKLKGKLSRPLDSFLLWPFGSRLDDSGQYIFVSKGLLFKARAESDIKSVGPGKIIFSDVVQHWRETLIIQHEDNYYSVYSGLKSPNLKVNDSVEQDQVIGKAASDEFYFELRHFDNPINPKNWFKETL